MRLLKAKNVAEVLGVTEARVYELIRLEVLPAVRMGRQVRVAESALNRFIETGGRPLPGGWRRTAAESEAL